MGKTLPKSVEDVNAEQTFKEEVEQLSNNGKTGSRNGRLQKQAVTIKALSAEPEVMSQVKKEEPAQ